MICARLLLAVLMNGFPSGRRVLISPSPPSPLILSSVTMLTCHQSCGWWEVFLGKVGHHHRFIVINKTARYLQAMGGYIIVMLRCFPSGDHLRKTLFSNSSDEKFLKWKTRVTFLQLYSFFCQHLLAGIQWFHMDILFGKLNPHQNRGICSSDEH